MATKLGTNNDNHIEGTGENDYLKGLGGDDHLRGGGGADHLDGGAGYDYALYQDSTVGVVVNLQTGRGYGGTAEGDTLVNIEGVVGSDHTDVLFGNDGDNLLLGLLGNDVLYGLDGDDLICGDHDGIDLGGDDALKGGGGDDTLIGVVGDDYLNGGAGRDQMYGDLRDGDAVPDAVPGADIFAWWYTEDTGTTEAAADVVYDFGFAEGDRIDLNHIDADVYAAGGQAFTFVGTDAFSGTPGEVRYYHSGGNTYLEIQTGMSVDVEGVIRLVGIHTPEASWFVL
jgi:Ca2+-binding RTX toxin-like protein